MLLIVLAALVAAAIGAALLLTGDDDGPAAPKAGNPGATAAPSSSDEPTPGTPDESIGGVSSAACQAEIDVVETAAEAYSTLNGTPPTSTRVLVDEGFLRELPEHVEIRDGTVTGTGPCA